MDRGLGGDGCGGERCRGGVVVWVGSGGNGLVWSGVGDGGVVGSGYQGLGCWW